MNAQSQTFAALLRRHRLAAGLSQEALSERAGLSRRGVSDLERGVIQAPHQDTVLRLADALRLEEPERALFAVLARGQETPASGAHAHFSGARASSGAPLVGRRHELALLDGQLAGRTPPLLCVAGEPGIGKSRLLAEAAARAAAQGWHVVTGGCTRRSGQEPYEPFVGALARALRHTPPARQRMDLQGCGWLAHLLPELLETRVAPAPAWNLPPEQERRLMFDAVARYLANMAGPSGTALLLDDLQWAGQDALDLLASLLDGIADSAGPPLRLVVAYRDTETLPADPLGLLAANLVGAGRAARIFLPPLSRDEAQTLLAQVWRDMSTDAAIETRADASEALQEEILRRADGLPFYIVSSARAVQTFAGDEETSISAHIPFSVAESVRARLAVLPEAARRLAEVAALAGRISGAPVVMAVSARPEEETLDALDALVQAGLLAEEGEETYRFTHDLIREVVEGELGSQRRRSLHRRLAEELGRTDDHRHRGQAAAIATHFLAAGERALALPYALLAGDQAAAVYARGEAAEYYGAALGLAQTLGDRASEAAAAEKRSAMLWESGRKDEARELGEHAAHLYQSLGDRTGELRALAEIAIRYAGSGQVEACEARILPRLAALEAEATEQDAGGLAGVYFGLSPVYVMSFRRSETLATLERGEYFARGVQDDALRLKNLVQRVYALATLSIADPRDEALQIIALAERLGDAESLWAGLNIAYNSYLLAGDLSSARSYLDRMIRQNDQTHRPATLLQAIGEIAFYCGDWRRARGAWEEVASIEEREEPFGAGMVPGYGSWNMGILELAQGHEVAASSRLKPALERAFATGDLKAQTFIVMAVAEAELLASRVDAAGVLLARVYAHPGMKDMCHWQAFLTPHVAWADVELGRSKRAQKQIEACEAYVRAQQMDLCLPDLLRVRAMVAIQICRWEAAKADLNEAITLAGAMPYPYAELKAWYVYGRMEAARGDPPAARECFEQALAICDRLGEGLYRPYIERDLAALQ
jgi:transcriptional regulator with XRE-family HTH domain/tetratricopeptide (TPR) repeat protein